MKQALDILMKSGIGNQVSYIELRKYLYSIFNEVKNSKVSYPVEFFIVFKEDEFIVTYLMT